MKRLIVAALAAAFSVCANAQVLGPYSVATNHSDDILGVTDTRPGIWGTAGYDVHTLTFHPPEGYRVRILRVYGDFQGFIRKNPTGNCAGVLWGLQSTKELGYDPSVFQDVKPGRSRKGSERAFPADDNTMLYVQDSICARLTFRDPVDFDTSVAGLLEPDNVLISKAAVFLNETGEPIHTESSFTIVFQYERQ